MRTKETMRAVLDQVPEDCSIDDVLYQLYVVQSVERGRADVDAGRTVSHEWVAAELRRKWLAPDARKSGRFERQILEDAAGYVAQDSPSAARRLLVEALDAAESLATLSERGRRVPELDLSITREILVGRHRLSDEVHHNQVFILAYLHGSRDFESWRIQNF